MQPKVTWERDNGRDTGRPIQQSLPHWNVTWERETLEIHRKLKPILWLTYLTIPPRANSFENGFSVMRNGDSCSLDPHHEVHTTQPHERDMGASETQERDTGA